MNCPSCNVEIHFNPQDIGVWIAPDHDISKEGVELVYGTCPRADHLIVVLRRGKYVSDNQGGGWLTGTIAEHAIYPPSSGRYVPLEVPASMRQDYDEAAAVLPVSPKASAALSRRILQQVLTEQFGIGRGDLATQIEAFLKFPNVPSFLSEAVDAIRQIGNLAAHPVKNKHTGEVVPVEPGEAEWLLEVLDALFDFAFVQPARLTAKRTALEEKLSAAGKPPLKRGVKRMGD